MKLNIKYLILFATFFFVTASYGQECEYEINEIDKFTKEKKILTKPVTVAESLKIGKILKIKSIKWKIKEDNNSKFLMTSYQLSKGTIMMQGTEKLHLLLDNDESISLNITTLMPSLEGKFNSYVFEHTYNITDEEISKLLEHEVKDIRVEAMINGFDYSISEEVSTRKIFQCIL